MTNIDHISGAFEGKCHLLPVRVYFEDTDFTGVVYHARYLHYFERGRTDFLRLKNIHHRDLSAGKFGKSMFFVVSAIHLIFKATATIDDYLVVETKVADVKGARIGMDQTIQRDGQMIASAKVDVVLVGENLRPMRIPEEIRQVLYPK